VASVHPKRVILFGSYAQGEPDQGSDLHLMVIEASVPDTYQEMIRLHAAVGNIGVGVDVLVYSDAEFEHHSQVPGRCSIGPGRRAGSCMRPNIEEARRSLRAADRDIKAFEILRGASGAPLAALCFHAQQAFEKSLKAVLFLHLIEFRRTHDLVKRLRSCFETRVSIRPSPTEHYAG
jgi:predicted nucleotidyltransferase